MDPIPSSDARWKVSQLYADADANRRIDESLVVRHVDVAPRPSEGGSLVTVLLDVVRGAQTHSVDEIFEVRPRPMPVGGFMWQTVCPKCGKLRAYLARVQVHDRPGQLLDPQTAWRCRGCSGLRYRREQVRKGGHADQKRKEALRERHLEREALRAAYEARRVG